MYFVNTIIFSSEIEMMYCQHCKKNVVCYKCPNEHRTYLIGIKACRAYNIATLHTTLCEQSHVIESPETVSIDELIGTPVSRFLFWEPTAQIVHYSYGFSDDYLLYLADKENNDIWLTYQSHYYD